MNNIKIKQNFFNLLKLNVIQELLFSAIGCVLFTFVFFLFPDEFWDYPNLDAFIGILALCFLFLLILLNQNNPKNKLFKVNYKRNIIIFSVYFYSITCFLYFNTGFAVNGIQGDNFYRTALVTRMAYSGYPLDFAYKGFSSFFSPLYWYCLALFARIFNIKPYKMLKLGILFLCYFIPILLFEVWKKIYKEKISFIITLITLISLFDAYSPDHMIVIFFIVPYIMYYYENCTKKEFKKKNYIFGGLWGAVLCCTFFYFFFIIPIYYILIFVQNRVDLKKKLKHISFITIFIMLFSSWFWGPILRDIVLIGFESHQNKYFGDGLLRIPIIYQLELYGVFGFIFFLGSLFIIRSFTISPDIRILGNLLLSINIIYIIGLIGIILKFPIMHARFLGILFYILIISFSILYAKLTHYLSNKANLKTFRMKFSITQIEVYFLLGLAISTSFGNFRGEAKSDVYKTAQDEDVRYDLIDIIKKLDYEDKVFLTNRYYAVDFLPIYLFLLPNPYFSHPSALYNERFKFLIELSECNNSKEFYELIVDNKFGDIDYFWLEINNSSDFVFSAAIEKFPNGRKYYDIVFKHEMFENEKYFKKIVIEDEIIYKTKI